MPHLVCHVPRHPVHKLAVDVAPLTVNLTEYSVPHAAEIERPRRGGVRDEQPILANVVIAEESVSRVGAVNVGVVLRPGPEALPETNHNLVLRPHPEPPDGVNL